MRGQQNVLIQRHMRKVRFRYTQYLNNGRAGILIFFSILISSSLIYFRLFYQLIYGNVYESKDKNP